METKKIAEKKQAMKPTESIEQIPKTENSAKSGKKIYVGPTIPGVAIRNTVFEGRIPVPLQEIVKAEPYFSNLFIDIGKYPDAELMILRKKGYIYDAYKKALEGRDKK